MTEINELQILTPNGFECAYKLFKIRMGDDFISRLLEPPGFKDYVTNESANEHGIRIVLNDTPKLKSREISLIFIISASSPEERRRCYNSFMQKISANNGLLTLRIPAEGDAQFELVLKDKGGEFSLSLDRCIAKYGFKFIEPKPRPFVT